jgi:hypothetical protein
LSGRRPALAEVRAVTIDLHRYETSDVLYLDAVFGNGRTIRH